MYTAARAIGQTPSLQARLPRRSLSLDLNLSSTLGEDRREALKRAMAALETLPTEVLLVILNKLAAQDLPSLLRAACVSKALFQVTGANSDIWKDIFHGPGVDESGNQVFREQSAKLDAEVRALGGYKQLVAAQHASQNAHGRLQGSHVIGRHPEGENIVSGRSVDPELTSFGETVVRRRFVMLIMLQGSPVLWAVHSDDEGASFRKSNAYNSYGVVDRYWYYLKISRPNLQPVYSIEQIKGALEQAREKGCTPQGGNQSSEQGEEAGCLCRGMHFELLELEARGNIYGPFQVIRFWSGCLDHYSVEKWETHLYLKGSLQVRFQLADSFTLFTSLISNYRMLVILRFGAKPSLGVREVDEAGVEEVACRACRSLDWSDFKLTLDHIDVKGLLKMAIAQRAVIILYLAVSQARQLKALTMQLLPGCSRQTDRAV